MNITRRMSNLAILRLSDAFSFDFDVVIRFNIKYCLKTLNFGLFYEFGDDEVLRRNGKR